MEWVTGKPCHAMEKTINFFIPGRPKAWQRVSHGRYGQTFVPKETADWQKRVAMFSAMNRPQQIILHEISISLYFQFKRPKSVSQHKLFCIGRSDIDNYSKSVLDAMQKIIFENDNQVVILTAKKIYSDVEGVRVFISSADSHQ